MCSTTHVVTHNGGNARDMHCIVGPLGHYKVQTSHVLSHYISTGEYSHDMCNTTTTRGGGDDTMVCNHLGSDDVYVYTHGEVLIVPHIVLHITTQ